MKLDCDGSFLGEPHSMECGMLVPCQGSNPWPQHWKLRVLTTRMPGKSPPMVLNDSCALELLGRDFQIYQCQATSQNNSVRMSGGENQTGSSNMQLGVRITSLDEPWIWSWMAWWLILCVNLTRAVGRWPRYLVKCYFYACLWGYFWVRLAFESSRLRKADYHPQCGWASSSLFRKWRESKGGGRILII